MLKVILIASGITFAQSELKLDLSGQKPNIFVGSDGIIHMVW